jgi:DNA polymerase/3'-5' exonuclease PolX
MDTDKRSAVADALMAASAEPSGNAFRARALRECSRVVSSSEPFADAAGARAALAHKLSARMMARVSEILADGDSEEAVVSRAVAELMTVTCIGPVAARKLVRSGVRSLEQLERAVAEGSAARLGLTAAQELCVRYRKDIAARIPRSEMTEHADVVRTAAALAEVRAEVVGSFRRNSSSSGDIDVLLVGNMDDFLYALSSMHYVVGTIARGGHKFMGLVRLPGRQHARRLDVLGTTPEELPFAMLHFTGPAEFNVAVRKVAIRLGLRLSERGWDSDTAPTPSCEADILRHLGVAWTEPEDRSGELREC